MTKRYTELADLIVKKIIDGELSIGTKLPNENELSSKYRVSRSTVRLALNIVQSLGLISRRRRVGTIVISDKLVNKYTKSLSTIEDLVHYAKNTLRVVYGNEDIICDQALALDLDCTPGQIWHRVQMLRVEKSDQITPVCWTNAYLQPDIADMVVPLIPNGVGLIYHLIENSIGRSIKNVRQEVTAASLSGEIAKKLNIAEFSLGLVVYRHYFDQGKKASLITQSYYPADRFKFTLWLHRSQVTNL